MSIANFMVKKYQGVIFLCLFMTVFISCRPERKLAIKFVKETKPGTVLILAPNFVYKSSYKIPDIENFDSLPQQEKDSISYFNSDIVQFCNDSIYIGNFVKSLVKGLEYFGYSVTYNKPADQFLTSGNESSFILNIAQIQLEEYIDSISDEASFDTESSNNVSIFITAINLNNWVEITRLNHVKSAPQLLFNSQIITDDFHGNFKYYPLTGNFNYEYSIDSLNVDKLYNAASELGYKHAQWVFDYLLNDYVKRNLLPTEVQEKLYTYDFRNKVLKRLRWNPFTPVNE